MTLRLFSVKVAMLFVQTQYDYLVKNIVSQEHFLVEQFAHQEFIIKELPIVTGQKCLVIGSLTASSDQALSLLLLVHALVKNGALQVILYSPYLGYQRQDIQNISGSQGLMWADAMLYATGIKSLITIEPHCQKLLPSLLVPVVTQTVELIFAQEITHFVSMGFTFIFPDKGSIERSAWLQELFPLTAQGFFLKKRDLGMIELESFQGKLGRKVIVCDDILDSGQTLLQTCIALKQMGVDEIVVFVTHAFFHGNAWNDLWSLGVKLLFCTNSLPQAHQIHHPQIHVKSIMPLLQKIL